MLSWFCPLRFNLTNRIISASRWYIWSATSKVYIQHSSRSVFTTALIELCNSWHGGVLQSVRVTFGRDSAEGWLTSELVAMADEGQAPFPAVPPSSLSRSPALFRARAAYTTPSDNSRAGNYSPVQPLITSAGRLVGQAVMWRSRAEEYM